MGRVAFRPALSCVFLFHGMGFSIETSPTAPDEGTFRTLGADFRNHAMPARSSCNLGHGLDRAPAPARLRILGFGEGRSLLIRPGIGFRCAFGILTRFVEGRALGL